MASAVRRPSRSRSRRRCTYPWFVVLCGAAVWAAGCGGGADVPDPVAIDAACAVSDGARVEVRGYLRLPERLSVTDRAVIDIFSLRGGAGDRASVELVLGGGPDQLERPEAGFTATSLRVRATAGTVATLNDRVVVVADVAREGAECVLRDPTVTVIPT